MEEPDDDGIRQTDQRHNTTMGNSVAVWNKGKAVASVNSFALPNGVGDLNRKDSVKKQRQEMQGVIEEDSVNMSFNSIQNKNFTSVSPQPQGSLHSKKGSD